MKFNLKSLSILSLSSVLFAQGCSDHFKAISNNETLLNEDTYDATTRISIASRITVPTDYIGIADPCVLDQQGIRDSINAGFGLTPPEQWSGCFHLKLDLTYAFRAIQYSRGRAMNTITQLNGTTRQINHIEEFNNQMNRVDQILATKFSNLNLTERNELKALTFSFVGSAYEMPRVPEQQQDAMIQEINSFIDNFTRLGSQARIKKPVLTPEALLRFQQAIDSTFGSLPSFASSPSTGGQPIANNGVTSLPAQPVTSTILNSSIPNFNERRYTECDRALQNAVINADQGTRQSAAAHNMSVAGLHYHMFGRQEGRDPKGEKCLLPEEVSAYLNCYPDISAAQRLDSSRTAVVFAQDHYKAFGQVEIKEGRRFQCNFLR